MRKAELNKAWANSAQMERRTVAPALKNEQLRLEAATFSVLDKDTKSCARIVMTREQLIAAFLIAGLVFISLLYDFALTLFVFAAVTTAFFFLNILFKFFLFGIGFDLQKKESGAVSILDHALPVISILVPLYREEQTLPSLISALEALDYPRDKLDIMLVLEDGDYETITAAAKLNSPIGFRVVVTPASKPKTKPKACNYALQESVGDIVVIYDAEDIPEPSQLRKAVLAFLAGDEKLACVQARLNYFNAEENWITRLFSLEYHMWFGFLLPTLERLGAPIPLGGTSNFLRTDVLRKIGAWDAFNVTEDADLGLRLARHGYRTEILASTTLEEATCSMKSWTRQRTRWIKGHMQTWLVDLRRKANDQSLATAMGRGVIHFFLAGSFFTALLAPPTALLFFLEGHLPTMEFGGIPMSVLSSVALAVMAVGYLFGIATNIAVAIYVKKPTLLWALPMAPVYWTMISIAAYRALFELIIRPHYWSKTTHVESALAKQRRRDLSGLLDAA